MLRVDMTKVSHELTNNELALQFNLGVAAMVVALGEITEKNLMEWTVRLLIHEKLFGASFVSKDGEYTSLVPLLPRFVGTVFNIAPERRSTFLKRMANNLESDIKRGVTT